MDGLEAGGTAEPRACLCPAFQQLLLSTWGPRFPLLLLPRQRLAVPGVQVVAVEPFSKATEPTALASVPTLTTYLPPVFLKRNLTDSSTGQL